MKSFDNLLAIARWEWNLQIAIVTVAKKDKEE